MLGAQPPGTLFHYSDTGRLMVNTGTTIVTFLMVFLIQNTQNRDGAALQAKLDELIRATERARNDLVAIERQSEEKSAGGARGNRRSRRWPKLTGAQMPKSLPCTGRDLRAIDQSQSSGS
ncbi:MAG TPA: low affinity iron permease family protein [Rhizomicrobium sp.]